MNIIVKHREVGATIATSIYLDHTHVISYRPGTRHESRAQEIAEKILTTWLSEALAPIVMANHCESVPEDGWADDDE